VLVKREFDASCLIAGLLVIHNRCAASGELAVGMLKVGHSRFTICRRRATACALAGFWRIRVADLHSQSWWEELTTFFSYCSSYYFEPSVIFAVSALQPRTRESFMLSKNVLSLSSDCITKNIIAEVSCINNFSRILSWSNVWNFLHLPLKARVGMHLKILILQFFPLIWDLLF
jgi:hypothetical protein